MESGRHIYLYRKTGHKRQKFRFTVDSQMNIVAEEPCHENGVVHKVTDDMKSRNLQTEAAIASSPQIRQLKARGIEFHISEGKIHFDSVPDIEIKIAQFFVPNADCPFPGCEPLRARYLEERETLKGEDGKCSSCDSGALQQKYRQLVINRLGTLAANDSPSNIGSGN